MADLHSTETAGDSPEHLLTLRTLTPADYADICEIMDRVYSRMTGAWKRAQFESQLARFPRGQLCVEDRGKVVAAALSVIVDYARYGDNHTYDEISGDGYLTTHDPGGTTLYGIDVFVHPDYRGLRLGRRLYDARKQLCEELNLRSIVIGGRVPNYHLHAAEMTVQEYVRKVQRAEIHDHALSFQLANDFHVRRIIRDYIPEDTESCSYAVLLEWINIYYEEGTVPGPFRTTKTVVRVGAVQWQMRPFRSMEGFIDQAEYFVDALAGYNADFVVFPEFFNGPLMAESNDRSPAAAIRHLATHTHALREALSKLAVSYNTNIIAGSMPIVHGEEVFNVSYLCRRDGTWDEQYKLHTTPDERTWWGMQGGSRLVVFDTDVAKVGILICYDVEFPELSRLLAEHGMQILFVPFLTDTKSGYLRVRRCAQARAVENECYVVIAGSVGNLPKVENMDIQYSQSAVLSPADFAFPHDAIISEATPNTEMTLVSDLDLDLIKELRHQGSVRNSRDRRTDLYRIEWVGDHQIEVQTAGRAVKTRGGR